MEHLNLSIVTLSQPLQRTLCVTNPHALLILVPRIFWKHTLVVKHGIDMTDALNEHVAAFILDALPVVDCYPDFQLSRWFWRGLGQG